MKQKQSEILFASMEYLDHDIIESAAAALDGKKKYSSPILKWSAVAAIVCVMISSLVVLVALGNMGEPPRTDSVALPPTSTAEPSQRPENTAPPSATEKPFQLPASPDDIVWSASEQNGPDGDGGAVEWNGMWVSYPLYEALKEMDDQTYMSLIVQSNDQELLDGFVFNGKTYQALQQEFDELRRLSTRLEWLFKEGHELKYGDALYTTGVPGVGKWTEKYYQERVDYYGVDLLNQYIKDGEFLSDAVEKDMQQNAEDIEAQNRILTDAMEAYLVHSSEELYAIFAEEGYCVTVKNGSLYLFLQKKDFANLKIANRESYLFHLASRKCYEGEVSEPQDLTIDDRNEAENT